MNNLDCTSYVTIIGIITALEWDRYDNVVTVGLSTSDEEEYLIEDNPLSEELLNLIYEPVKVTGFLNINECGYKSIFIADYELLEEDEFFKITELKPLKI